MKTALILSGKFRDFKDIYPTLKSNVIDMHSPDIFISTWSDNDSLKESFHAGTVNIEDSVTASEVIEILNPSGIVEDDYLSIQIQNIKETALGYSHLAPQTGEFNPISFFMMWYKIKTGYLLMEKHEKKTGKIYDKVIRARFDLKILDPLVFSDETNEVCIPIGYDWRGGINDTFAYGSRKSMEYYCNLFDYVQSYLKTGKILFHPETLLKHHMNDSGFFVKRDMIRTVLRGINVWEK